MLLVVAAGVNLNVPLTPASAGGQQNAQSGNPNAAAAKEGNVGPVGPNTTMDLAVDIMVCGCVGVWTFVCVCVSVGVGVAMGLCKKVCVRVWAWAWPWAYVRRCRVCGRGRGHGLL